VASTALITGAYGYLGSIIRSRLESAGWATVALVRRPRPDDRAVAWALGDRPPAHVLERADALVHCAYDFAQRGRSDVWVVNVDGTSALLDSARHAGVPRMLVLSSMSAYPGTQQLYGQAKLAIEELTTRSGGIAIRPGLVYGPAAGGVVGVLQRLAKLPLVPIVGGDARQFPVLAEDLTGVVLVILEAPSWAPEVFGVAQPRPMKFRQIMAALARRADRRCRFVPVPWRLAYGALCLVEATGARLPLRSDSVLGLVRPAPFVPRSTAFPKLLNELSDLGANG
jgi:nucleoside-diphosphate-sugar epimerase